MPTSNATSRYKLPSSRASASARNILRRPPCALIGRANTSSAYGSRLAESAGGQYAPLRPALGTGSGLLPRWAMVLRIARDAALRRDLGKVIEALVWNHSGQRIGRLEHVLITYDGKVDQVVIAVGGFLGGRKRVAVPFSQLRFGPSRLAPWSNVTIEGAPLVGNAADGGINAYGVVLPGATRDTVRAMPPFTYVP